MTRKIGDIVVIKGDNAGCKYKIFKVEKDLVHLIRYNFTRQEREIVTISSSGVKSDDDFPNFSTFFIMLMVLIGLLIYVAR